MFQILIELNKLLLYKKSIILDENSMLWECKHREGIFYFTKVLQVFLGYLLMFNQSVLEINRSPSESQMKKAKVIK